MSVIIFNGKTYNSLEEMPANERQAYEQIANMLVDKNGNGIPDFLEGDMVKNVMTAFVSSLNVNGQNYDGMNDMPPEIRAKVQGAFEKLSELGVVTKSTSPMVMQVNGMQVEQKPQMVSKPLVPQGTNPAVQEESGPNVLLLSLAGIVLVFCLAIAAFAVFYFMR